VSFDIVDAIYNALKDFVTWIWQWIASAINWFINTVINTLYNIFVSVLNTLMDIVNTITSWIWNSIRSLVILPAQSALQNALAFIQKKLFGTIYIASLVKLYEIQIKDFTEKPSVKKFLLLLAKPFLLYIGLSIMWGMLSSMGYMPTIQNTTPISPIPSTPTPTSGVQQLPAAPLGISVSDVFRYDANARGSSAYIQSIADSIRYGLNIGQSTPQQLPASYDALRYGITASVITNASVGGYIDNLRYSITANVVKPTGALLSDVVRNSISARGIVMTNIRASDTVYSSIKQSIVPITTIKPIDVVNSQVVSQAKNTAFIGTIDTLTTSLDAKSQVQTANVSGIDPNIYAPTGGWTKAVELISQSDLDNFTIYKSEQVIYTVQNGMLSLIQGPSGADGISLYFDTIRAKRVAIAFRLRNVMVTEKGGSYETAMIIWTGIYDQSSNWYSYRGTIMDIVGDRPDGTVNIRINYRSATIYNNRWYVLVHDDESRTVTLYDETGSVVLSTSTYDGGFNSRSMANLIQLLIKYDYWQTDIDWIAYKYYEE
jgi:hypothetical protein